MRLLELTDECLDAAEGNLPEQRGSSDRAKTKRPIRINVFKNRFLETYLAQAHPVTPGIWFGPFVVWGLYDGIRRGLGLWQTLALFGLGVLITTFIEYVVHRWLFHMAPKTRAQRVQHFLLHGYHHEFPNDAYRLVLPPIGVWPLAVVVGFIWYAVFGSVWLQVFAGTAFGYIGYDWIHYYTHHFNPKRGAGRWLKRYHMLHHFDSPNHRYGITSPLWDVVFGTYLPLKTMVRGQDRSRPNPIPTPAQV